jgi:hypothetical protein
MKAWPKVRVVLRIAFLLLLVGYVADAFASRGYPAPAVIGLSCVYAAVALLARPVGRLLGLPAFRSDEAYVSTLRRWRLERRNTATRSL